MSWTTSALCIALAVTLATIGGCAKGYHAFQGCYIDCKYCPLPPLPYTHYDGCECHSCAARY